ncbi:MAG: hypothetical protein KatS3mg119_2255 [Rhodothalassiaceae bacterium]|nr:MAG: hypothetical protein KatS3mg119_2255 [Rhodothalassiaceae bacterium]
MSRNGIDREVLRDAAQRSAQQLTEEVARLRRELELKEKRLRALQELLATFEAEEGSGNSSGAQKTGWLGAEGGVAAHIPEFRNVRERTRQLLEACWRILAEEGRPLPTREIVERLEERGLSVGGKNKVATLSAALSHSPHFRTLGRTQGWEIVPGAVSEQGATERQEGN